MPTYYVFKPTTGMGRAITDDRTGAKLPSRQHGGWVFDREIVIDLTDPPRVGASSSDIINGVARDGYLLWPQ